MSRAAAPLAGFGLLAGYASFHWFALVADPSLGRWLGVLAIALGTAVALTRVRRLGTGRAILAAMVATIAGLVAALAVVGVPLRMLAPGGLGELRAELDAGLAGVSQVELPYDGPIEWTRLGILLAAPLVVIAAAAVAFWPAGRERLRRGIALALLVSLYGVAVTWESPAAELAHGIGLLAAIAAFLWLGRLPAPRAAAAAVALAAAGLVALPAAARVSTTDPTIDYAGWNVFGDERTAEFEWDHSYGPLDWPQRGVELFEVRGAERGHYWKTTVLDEFDGAVWRRDESPVFSGFEPVAVFGATAEMIEARPDWSREIEVTVLGLRSPLAVNTGTPRELAGITVGPIAPDGTTRVFGDGLVQGSDYSFTAYAPDPSARLLRRHDHRHHPRELERYTTLLLPDGTALPGVDPAAAPVDPLVSTTQPIRGTRAAETAPSSAEALAGTPYGRVAALSERLTAGARGNYQAVAAVKRHLLENYEYDQDVPERRYPLAAFLFRDRAGYCQQFSGAMVLMLRLAGIPSRVASGFAPGARDRDDGTHLVRDTDAHSWVEVWFPRVGWVTVDPTPADAPAVTDSLPQAGTGAVPGRSNRAFAIGERDPSRGVGAVRASEAESDGGLSLRGAFSLFVLAGGTGLFVVYRRRRSRLLSPAGAGPQVRELERAMRLPGGRAPAGITLLRIERELAVAVGPAAARYPAGLRENRYGRRNPRRPGPRERRLLRRALGRRGGLLGRWRALRAIPPGGPARDRHTGCR